MVSLAIPWRILGQINKTENICDIQDNYIKFFTYNPHYPESCTPSSLSFLSSNIPRNNYRLSTFQKKELINPPEDCIINCATPETNYPTDPSVCTYTVPGTELDPIFVNCSGGIATNDFNNDVTLQGAIFPLGSTLVTWTVTDGNNVATCNYTIIIVDNQDPSITCPSGSPFARNTDPNQCYYTVQGTEFDATFSDNCPGSTLSNSFNGSSTLAGAQLPKGSNTITWTVTDASGNTAVCPITVNVTDDQDPSITCPSNITGYTPENSCKLNVSVPDPIIGDNCGVTSNNCSWTMTGATFGSGTGFIGNMQFDVGITTIVYTIKDAVNNTATCTFTVDIIDNFPPVISNCPGNITLYTGTGSTICGQSATWTEPTATDNCTPVSQLVWTKSHLPGYTFPVGTTTVTYTVTDAPVNTATCIFTVTVIDNTPPSFTPPPSITINTNTSCSYNASPSITGFPTSIYDNCTPSGLAANFTDGPLNGPCYGTGFFTRTWSVTDIHANTTTYTQTITVSDNIPPNLTPPTDISISCSESTLPANTGQANATDNCSATVTITYSDNTTPGNCFNDYTITRTWKGTDCSGNNTLKIQTITISDYTPPEIISIFDTEVPCPDSIPFPDPNVIVAQDNCLADSLLNITLLEEIPFGLEDRPGYCPDSVYRKYRVEDSCSNYIDALQTIVVDSICDCAPCNSDSSFYQVDFIGQPYGDTLFTQKKRWDKCCKPDKSDYCISFNVRIDPDAVGVYIEVGGSTPQPHDWKVDCIDVPINDGIICLPGVTFHLFTYCKPGHNANDFYFKSIAGIVVGDDINARVGCGSQITVDSTITNPVWNSISPGDIGEWNSYLHPSNTVLSPQFIPDTNSPTSIDYQICGSLGTIPCVDSLGIICDTITVYVKDSIQISFNIDPSHLCLNEMDSLQAIVNPPGYNYIIEWYQDYNALPENLIYTGPTWQPTLPGQYSIKVTDTEEGNPCSTAIMNFEVGFDESPPLIYPPPDTIVDCSDPLTLQNIIIWLSRAYALDDNGDSLWIDDDYAGIELICNNVDTVIFFATDECGNMGTATSTIFVTDYQPPVIYCPPNTTGGIDPNTCLATDVVLGTATAIDACPGTVTIYNDAPAEGFPVGTSIVTWTATDECNNSATCTQIVTIYDDIPPLYVECPNDTTVYNEIGKCGANIVMDSLVASDPCSPVIIINDYTGTEDASGFYPVGITCIIWTVSDTSGNAITCLQTVTVVDNESPAIICPNDTVFTAPPPECQLDIKGIADPVLWDNCDSTFLTWIMEGATTGSGTGSLNDALFDVGITSVTYTVSDTAGNSASCTFTVTVNDQVPPTVIDCPTDTTAYADLGKCDTYVEVPQPMVSDSCGEIVSIRHDSPYGISPDTASGTYPVGVHTITWTFTDQSGNDTTCVQTIIVHDDQSPVLSSCPDSVFAIAEPPDCEVPAIDIEDPVYSDNCPDPLLTWIKTGATNGSGTGLVDTTQFNVGVTYVTYIVTDSTGNDDSCTFVVIVNDELPPTEFTCPGDTTVFASDDSCAVFVRITPPEVTDPCGEIVSVTHDSPVGTPGDASGIYDVGIYTITWTFTDASGNDTTCEQVIEVRDTINPLLICPPSFDLPADYNLPFATNVPVDIAVYADACGVETLTWLMTGVTTGNSPFTGINQLTLVDTLFVGVTTITYTAVDSSGNISTCNFDITVISKPEIACPDTMTAYADEDCIALISTDTLSPELISGVQPITWYWQMTGATIDSGTGNPIVPSPYPFNVDTTWITWFAENISGMDTCVQVVIVIDTIPATFNAPNDTAYCVLDIYSAMWDGFPDPIPGADIKPEEDWVPGEPRRPDWYILVAGSTELDVTGINDNCCDLDSIQIYWTILDSNNAVYLSGTGQPSAYDPDDDGYPDPIVFQGNENNTEVYYTMIFYLVDCYGIVSEAESVNITIKPRPNLIKQY
ncbi:MAG: HYR domain-containing protein [Lentimicrobiaceae bacterium]|nr:HYR domain-containing protein [Lentimicrobiaceae bacterium]